MDADELVLGDKMLELMAQGMRFGDDVVALCEQWWRLSHANCAAAVEVLLGYL